MPQWLETLECRLHDLSSNPSSHKGAGKTDSRELFSGLPTYATMPRVPAHTRTHMHICMCTYTDYIFSCDVDLRDSVILYHELLLYLLSHSSYIAQSLMGLLVFLWLGLVALM